MKLAFKQIGAGPPIVILHGLFGMSDNWMNIAKKLSAEYCFYLLDLRNHGHSPHDDQINFQLTADDVTEFLDTHKLFDVTLLGHSLGGKVAIQTAVQSAYYLKKLVIADIANKVYQTSYFEEYMNAMLSIDLSDIQSRKDAEKAFLAQRVVEPAVLQFLLKNLYRDADNNFKWRLNLKALKNNINNILTDIKIEDPVQIATIFMKGSESAYIRPEDETRIKSEFENARIVMIDGANHWLHFSAQDNFITALKNFQEEN
jgi:esterase